MARNYWSEIIALTYDRLHHMWYARTSNQFVVYRSAAKKLLKVGTNELLLEFANAFKKVI